MQNQGEQKGTQATAQKLENKSKTKRPQRAGRGREQVKMWGREAKHENTRGWGAGSVEN